MPASFHTIGLIGRHRRANISDTLQAVKDYLCAHKLNLVIEQETARWLPHSDGIESLPGPLLAKACDLLIVVGGDGSLLHAAHIAVHSGIPVLGINRGYLGFLTDIRPKDLEEKIGEVLNGHYQEEQRFLLKAELYLNKTLIWSNLALNDVVLTVSDIPDIVEFSIHIDKQFVCAHRADGLIIATPTGSTAYALSGGGPILHPQMDALVLLPMFSHSLTARPIVVSANSEVGLWINPETSIRPKLRCDGQAKISIPPHTEIYINRYAQTLRLIHPVDYNYFDTLRTKLHWQRTINDLEV